MILILLDAFRQARRAWKGEQDCCFQRRRVTEGFTQQRMMLPVSPVLAGRAATALVTAFVLKVHLQCTAFPATTDICAPFLLRF
jgi:hypothetical protein